MKDSAHSSSLDAASNAVPATLASGPGHATGIQPTACTRAALGESGQDTMSAVRHGAAATPRDHDTLHEPCARKGRSGQMHLKQNPQGRILTFDTCERMDGDEGRDRTRDSRRALSVQRRIESALGG